MDTFDLALLLSRMDSKEAPNSGPVDDTPPRLLAAALVLLYVRLN
jgi:hypothetical protein